MNTIPAKTDNPQTDTLTSLMPPLQRLARILANTPEQADDLAQEALVQVWGRLKNGDNINDLRPYLMTTLRNASRRPHRADQELTDANTPSCPPEAPGRMACEDVTDAISKLSDDQQTLLAQLINNGTSYQALANRYELPIGTVMSRIARARRQLRKDLNLPASHAVEVLLDH